MIRAAGRVSSALLALGLCLSAPPAHARELWTSEDAEDSLVLGSTLKSSFLLSRAPRDALLFPERTGAANLWRLRFDLSANAFEWLTASTAYELRSKMASGGAAATGMGILPPETEAPFRVAQLQDTLVDQSPELTLAHELDRALLAFHLPFGELTVGRQAIGMGSGVLFSAADLFAPFSPLEIDREWRRGVDAVHAEVRILPELSVDATAAFEPEIDDLAAVARIRGRFGDLDGSLIGGRRSEDWLGAATLSAALGDAEVHGELAVYATDGRGIEGGWLGTDDVVGKAVVGAWNQFDVGRGLRVVAEYHYSGFGLKDVRDDQSLLFDAAFADRLARGDTQILGRHAVALVVSYDLLDPLTGALTFLQSPVDGSGILAPTLTWTYSDGVTLVASGIVPFGTRPTDGRLRSEYGSSPFALFLQATVYD